LFAHAASVVGHILARTDSSRLPGKALMPIAGVPLIGYVIERARLIPGLDGLVLATTDRQVDDELAAYASSCGIDVCRGATDDVVGRLLDCARPVSTDYVLRLNGDTPFLDPALIGEGLSRTAEGYDVISNIVGRTFPYGVSVEIIKRAALERAYPNMSPTDREHVTQYFYQHQEQFSISVMTADVPGPSGVRMVVDDEADLRRFEAVARMLGDDVLTADYQQVAACYQQIQ